MFAFAITLVMAALVALGPATAAAQTAPGLPQGPEAVQLQPKEKEVAKSSEASKPQEKTEEKKTVEKTEVHLIPPIMVTASRLRDVLFDLSRIPAQVRVVTEEEIETSKARTVPEVIKYQPGITLYDAVGNAFEPVLELRGFSGDPVNTTTVILDGVRVNNPGSAFVDFDLIPVEDLERIEVVPGTAAVYGKNALAGIVNLQTKRGGPVPVAKLEVAGGSFGRHQYRASLGGPVGDFDYYLGFTQYLEDGFREYSDSDVRKIFAKVGRPIPTLGTDVTLSFLFVDDHLGRAGALTEDELGQDRTQSIPPPGDFVERRLDAGTLNLRQELPAGFSVALNAFVRDLEEDSFDVFRSGLTSRVESDLTTGGGIAQVTHEATPFDRRNVFVVGVESTQSDTVNTDSGTFPSDRETDEHVVGIYFQESFDLIPEVLILSAGGRYDWDRIDFTDRLDPTLDRGRTFEQFSPVAGLTLIATDPEVMVYFSYSEGFRTPTVFELFAFAPFSSNPDLEAPTSRTYEVGTRTRLGEYFEGTLALFQTDVKEDVLFVPTGPFSGRNENVGETRRQGVEVTLNGQYGELVDGFVNYSYIEATFEEDVLLGSGQVSKGNGIPLVPEHRLGVGVNVYPIEGLNFSLTGLYVSERFFAGDEPNLVKQLNDYFVMNGSVTYQLGSLTLFVRGENILDTEYEPWGVFSSFTSERFLVPAAGINVLAGVQITFQGAAQALSLAPSNNTVAQR